MIRQCVDRRSRGQPIVRSPEQPGFGAAGNIIMSIYSDVVCVISCASSDGTMNVLARNVPSL